MFLISSPRKWQMYHFLLWDWIFSDKFFTSFVLSSVLPTNNFIVVLHNNLWREFFYFFIGQKLILEITNRYKFKSLERWDALLFQIGEIFFVLRDAIQVSSSQDHLENLRVQISRLICAFEKLDIIIHLPDSLIWAYGTSDLIRIFVPKLGQETFCIISF